MSRTAQYLLAIVLERKLQPLHSGYLRGLIGQDVVIKPVSPFSNGSANIKASTVSIAVM